MWFSVRSVLRVFSYLLLTAKPVFLACWKETDKNRQNSQCQKGIEFKKSQVLNEDNAQCSQHRLDPLCCPLGQLGPPPPLAQCACLKCRRVPLTPFFPFLDPFITLAAKCRNWDKTVSQPLSVSLSTPVRDGGDLRCSSRGLQRIWVELGDVKCLLSRHLTW